MTDYVYNGDIPQTNNNVSRIDHLDWEGRYHIGIHWVTLEIRVCDKFVKLCFNRNYHKFMWNILNFLDDERLSPEFESSETLSIGSKTPKNEFDLGEMITTGIVPKEFEWLDHMLVVYGSGGVSFYGGRFYNKRTIANLEQNGE